MLASKFINCLMHDGKKSTAQDVFYDAWTSSRRRSADVEPIEVFTQAVENVKPAIEVRSKRVGGAAYQVPMQVNRTRQQSLAIRWILLAVREKKGRPTHEKLAEELWPPTTAKARPCPAATTSIAWPTPTRRSRTSPGNLPPVAEFMARQPSQRVAAECRFVQLRSANHILRPVALTESAASSYAELWHIQSSIAPQFLSKRPPDDAILDRFRLGDRSVVRLRADIAGGRTGNRLVSTAAIGV